MMKSMKNRLKKCCRRTQAGNGGHRRRVGRLDGAGVAMNRCTEGSHRSPLATATATMSNTKPIGGSHSRLNHLPRPMRTRGGCRHQDIGPVGLVVESMGNLHAGLGVVGQARQHLDRHGCRPPP